MQNAKVSFSEIERADLDRLYWLSARADDANDMITAYVIENHIQDLLNGDECPRPELALIASLLLRPDGLREVKTLLPNEKAFLDHQLRKVYKAMLATEITGAMQRWEFWVAVSRAAGIGVDATMAILQYPYFNAYRAMIYARAVFANAAQRAMIEAAETLAKGACGDSPLEAVGIALRKIQALQARIVGASELLVPHSES